MRVLPLRSDARAECAHAAPNGNKFGGGSSWEAAGAAPQQLVSVWDRPSTAQPQRESAFSRAPQGQLGPTRRELLHEMAREPGLAGDQQFGDARNSYAQQRSAGGGAPGGSSGWSEARGTRALYFCTLL